MALAVAPEYKVILLGEYGVGKTTFLNHVQRITRHGVLDVSHSDNVECAIPVGPPEKQVTAKVIVKGNGGGGGSIEYSDFLTA